MTRSVVIATIGFIAAIAAIVLFLSVQREEATDTAQKLPAPASESAPAIAETDAPSFDVVRIGEQGDAVLAGRAKPGAEVVIRDGGREIGRVTADARGEWVFVPDLPMAPGARELTLEARSPDGAVLTSGDPVILVVPERAGDPALAIRNAKDGARLLQGPAAGDGVGPLTIDLVDHDGMGGLRVTGRAENGAEVRLYLDNTLAGDAKADRDGIWVVTGKAPAAGHHTLRADQVDARGKVLARMEIPYDAGVDFAADGGTVVVQPGNSLWRIARRLYGEGPAFLVIYRANKNQIRDPDLIYPGQVFQLPKR